VFFGIFPSFRLAKFVIYRGDGFFFALWVKENLEALQIWPSLP